MNLDLLYELVLVGLVGLVFIFIYKKQYLHFYTS